MKRFDRRPGNVVIRFSSRPLGDHAPPAPPKGNVYRYYCTSMAAPTRYVVAVEFAHLPPVHAVYVCMSTTAPPHGRRNIRNASRRRANEQQKWGRQRARGKPPQIPTVAGRFCCHLVCVFGFRPQSILHPCCLETFHCTSNRLRKSRHKYILPLAVRCIGSHTADMTRRTPAQKA